MRIGSLFSGAGGLDMAVESVFGGRVIWQSEMDKAASKVLTHRWPDVPNLGDVTNINWDTVESVDIICGGYPCQPFSVAGQREGTNDERHLWPYFADAIRRVRPRYAILENVAGHRSMGFDSVLGDLAALGYDAQWICLRASDIGAPHRRERLFILAHTESNGRQQGGTESTREQRGSDAPVGGDATANSSSTTVGKLTRRAPSQETGTHSGDGPGNSAGKQSHLNLLPTPKASDGTFETSRVTGRPVEKSTALGTIVSLDYQWGKYAPAVARWESLTRPAPAPTAPNSKDKPRLAPAFSEWMMGWPAGWVTDPDIGISRNDQLRIVGNGVVPQQAIAALTYLLKVAEVAA